MQAGKTIFKLCMFPYEAVTISNATASVRLTAWTRLQSENVWPQDIYLTPEKHRLACYKILNNGADKVTGSKRVLTGHRAAHLGAITSSHG